jgi:hypothetical protein
MAPGTGFGPATIALTGRCSTTELPRNHEHCIGNWEMADVAFLERRLGDWIGTGRPATSLVGSGDRIRTCDQSVNSRLLYH